MKELPIIIMHNYWKYISTNDAQFDIITCMELINMYQILTNLISHCAQLLKPGGNCYFNSKSHAKILCLGHNGAEYILIYLHKLLMIIKIYSSCWVDSCYKRHMQLAALQGLKFQPFTKSATLQVNAM